MAKETSEIVEAKIHFAWVRLSAYVNAVMPNGVLEIKFVNGIPTKLANDPHPDIRFDKQDRSLPTMPGYEFETHAGELTKKVLTNSKT